MISIPPCNPSSPLDPWATSVKYGAAVECHWLDRLVQEERERAGLDTGGGAASGGGGGTGDANGGGGEGAPSGSGIAENPRPLGLMEADPDNLNSLGGSSMSVMKAAFGSSTQSGVDSSNDNQDES